MNANLQATDRIGRAFEREREARPDAVSTLEAVALALAVLESDAAPREKLLMPFRELLAKARAAGIRDSKKRDRRVRR